MAYEVRLYREARRYLERCDRPTQKRLITRLEELSEAPYQQSKALHGAGSQRSSRVGKWRIVYEPDDRENVLSVYSIGARGDVYNRL